MSVAQKDGIKAAEGISYDDLYRRWEQSNWQATRDRLRRGPRGLGRADRDPAPLGALDLLDVLLRRGLGRRQPLPLHRRGAEAGAEVLPRHPAGRRGPPRGLLPPLLQGGDRRRRLDLLDPRLHRAAAQLGLPQRLRPARPDGRRPAPRPLAAELRPRDRALPHGRRGDPGPARPALHRGLLRQRGDDARVQRGDGERLARRAAPHRLRGQGALRVLRRVGGVQGGGRRAAARGAAVLARRLLAAQLGPRVHPLLRLRARGHLRLRPALGADQVAGDRLPARGDAGRAAGRPGARRRRRSRGAS